MRGMIRAMRHAGLAIQDAATLERDHIQKVRLNKRTSTGLSPGAQRQARRSTILFLKTSAMNLSRSSMATPNMCSGPAMGNQNQP